MARFWRAELRETDGLLSAGLALVEIDSPAISPSSGGKCRRGVLV